MDSGIPLVTVTWTVPSEEEGLRLVRGLVEDRLVACGQVGAPITSVYRWEGELREAAEHPVTCKTTAALADRVVEAVADRHSYDVPEVLVAPVIASTSAYAEWVRDQTA
jgi:periplasmic divalent cation tolerance protein